MNEIRQVPSLLAQSQTPKEQDSSSRGFISFTYDQCERAYNQIYTKGKRVSLEIYAEAIEQNRETSRQGRFVNTFDILETVHQLQNKTQLTEADEKFLALLLKMMPRKEVMETYATYREALQALAKEKEQGAIVTYQEIMDKTGTSRTATMQYLNKSQRGLVAAFGLTLENSKKKSADTESGQVDTNGTDYTKQRPIFRMSTLPQEQLDDLALIIHKLRQPDTSPLPIRFIAERTRLGVTGTGTPVSSDFIKALLDRMRKDPSRKYDEALSHISDH